MMTEQERYERLCNKLLNSSLEIGRLDRFLFYTHRPQIRNRFVGTSEFDYFGMMETLYKKHVSNPELNIPKMIEDAIKYNLEEKNFDPTIRMYKNNLEKAFNIIYAHLLEIQEKKATFDFEKEIYDLIKDKINNHKSELEKLQFWDQMVEKNQTSIERVGRSIL